MSVASASEKDERSLLVALQGVIAQQIDEGVPPRDLASLSRRLIEIRREIATIDAQKEKDGGGVVDTPDDEWDGDF